LGRAMAGVIDVIAIHGCGWSAERLTVTAGPVAAAEATAAGTAGSSPPATAAVSAASRRHRRPRCCR